MPLSEAGFFLYVPHTDEDQHGDRKDLLQPEGVRELLREAAEWNPSLSARFLVRDLIHLCRDYLTLWDQRGEPTEAMTVDKLFDIFYECRCEHGHPYLNHFKDDIDVPPRPFDHITIDGTFDTQRLLAALTTKRANTNDVTT